MKELIAVVPLALVCLLFDTTVLAAPEASAVAPPGGTGSGATEHPERVPVPSNPVVSPGAATDSSKPGAPMKPESAPTKSGSVATVKPGASAPAQEPSNPSSGATDSKPAAKPDERRSPFEDCHGSEPGKESRKDCSGVFGLRAGITHANLAGSDDAIGLTVSARGEKYETKGLWSTRGVYQLAIGGGGAGFEGALLGGWAGGMRLPVAPDGRHGPVLRLGMYGYMLGNDAVYGSLIELPQIQVGYQYKHEKTLVELGATGGAVLVGRSRIADTERRILGSGFEYGGYLAVRLRWLRVGVSANRLPVDDALSTPVDVVQGVLCGTAAPFAICTDARATFTDAFPTRGGASTEVRSVQGGLTLGVTSE